MPDVADPTTGRIFSTRGPVDAVLIIPDDSAFATTVPAGWALAVDGVKRPDGPIFAPSTTTAARASWTIAFESERINQKEGAGVVMKTTVTQRPQATSATHGGCF